jgi:transcriptional regulator with XRE-family HTH domain
MIYHARMQTQDFRTALRAALDRRDWNYSDLGRAAGISPSVIARWLPAPPGIPRRPTPENLERLAPALGIPYEDLMQLCGYLPGAPLLSDLPATELEIRLTDVGQTLSTLPRSIWEPVVEAIEAMATAGEALQAPTNGSGPTENNQPVPRLSGHQHGRRRRITPAYAWVSTLVHCLFLPLAVVAAQS